MSQDIREKVQQVIADHEEQANAAGSRIVPWSQVRKRDKTNLKFMTTQRELYKAMYGEAAETNPDFIKYDDAVFALEAKQQTEEDKVSPAEMRRISKEILDPLFRRCEGGTGQQELLKIKDERNKIIEKVTASKAIKDQLLSATAEIYAAMDDIKSPMFIRSLVDYWEIYGEKIDKYLVYGGFDKDTWCFGRSLVQPSETIGDMPTWTNFLSRMNDPEAFAAWIYGIASKRYRGRQVLWLCGPHGEDGKTYTQRILVRNVFPNVSHAMSNSALGEGASRFIGAEFENKALAYWDDCNNQMALFREDIKMLSSGAEGQEARIEHKGIQAYSAQLETRMWINSNFAPVVSHDNFIRSRLLYIHLDAMDDKPDPDIGVKFVQELPSFLAFGKVCFEKLCKDTRTIEQNDVAQEQIDDLASNFESEHERILEKHFKIDLTENDHSTCDHIQEVLKYEGLKDHHKQSDFYNWLARRYKLTRSTLVIDGKKKKIVKGVKPKTTIPDGRAEYGSWENPIKSRRRR